MSLKLVNHNEYKPKERTVINQWVDQIQQCENFFRNKYEMDKATFELIKDTFISLEPGFLTAGDLEILKKNKRMILEVPSRIGNFNRYYAAVDIKLLSSDRLKDGTVKERSLSKEGKDLILERVVKASRCMIPTPCKKLIINIYLDREITDIFEYDLTTWEEEE